MENILAKALDEVLTPRYSDELRDSYDTGYAVTAEFELKMRELIRKTDKHPIKWGRYAAVVAAAVIAVGSAVLVPILMNNRVEVSPTVPEETTTAVTAVSGTLPEITTAGSMSVFSVSAENIITSSSVEENVPYVGTDSGNTAESVPEELDETAPALTVPAENTDAATIIEPVTTPDTEPVGTSLTEKNGESSAEEKEDYDVNETTSGEGIPSHIDLTDENYSDENPVIGVDTGDEDDDDLPEQPDAEEEEEEETIEPEDCEDEIHGIEVTVQKGIKLSQLFREKFGISFDNIWADSGNYYPGGVNGITGDYYFAFRDLDFVQEFVHKLGNAECVEVSEFNNYDEYINLCITDVRNTAVITPSMMNSSQWLYYDRYFGNTEQPEYDDEEMYEEEIIDDEQEYPMKNMSVLISITRKDCIVRFDDMLCIYRDSGGNTVYYRINGDFRMPESDVRELFEKTEKLYIPENVKTAGDIAEKMGITEDNIVRTSANVSGIYDTSIINAGISGSYIADLFRRYSDQTVQTDNQHGVFNGVVSYIDLKNGSHLLVAVDIDRKVYVFDGMRNFCFGVPDSEVTDAVNEISSANGINIPIYSTLGEYLADKNFTKLTSVRLNENVNGRERSVKITDASELEILTEMLKAELSTAAYEKGRRLSNTKDIHLDAENYRVLRIDLTRDDRLVIQASNIDVFKLSDGFYNRFRKAVLEITHTLYENSNDTDEIDYHEEEIIDPDEADYPD